jgi:aminopeptidase N
VASDPEYLTLLGKLADGAETVEGLTIDQDMRWSIAVKHVAYGVAGAEQRMAAEAERDPSDRGQRATIRGGVAVPTAAAKEVAWGKIVGEGYGSLYLTSAAMSGFNWFEQREVLEPYVDRFFNNVSDVFRSKDKEFASDFFRFLSPAYRVEKEMVSRAEKLLADGQESPVLTRMLKEFVDDMTRAIRCREFAAG